MVKVYQNLPLCDLGYVVHGLARVVPYAGILVCEAGEDGWDDDFEVSGELLVAAESPGAGVSREAVQAGMTWTRPLGDVDIAYRA